MPVGFCFPRARFPFTIALSLGQSPVLLQDGIFVAVLHTVVAVLCNTHSGCTGTIVDGREPGWALPGGGREHLAGCTCGPRVLSCRQAKPRAAPRARPAQIPQAPSCRPLAGGGSPPFGRTSAAAAHASRPAPGQAGATARKGAPRRCAHSMLSISSTPCLTHCLKGHRAIEDTSTDLPVVAWPPRIQCRIQPATTRWRITDTTS
jgi:hypothetical protein